MENTKTLNVISTPNIEGNVGSCSTKVEKMLLQGHFWSEDGQTIATNSCTGEVTIYPYHQISGASVWLFIIGIFIAGFIVKALID